MYALIYSISLLKQGNPVICCNVGEVWGQKPVTKRKILPEPPVLYGVSKIVRSIETESGLVAVWGWQDGS